MRITLKNARTIGTYVNASLCRHPILAFALTRVPAAVIESQLLRFAEALPLLNRASVQALGRPLLARRHRDWKALDADFDLLLMLRDYRVAHMVQLRTLGDEAYAELESKYPTPFDFLDVVLDKLELLMDELVDAGFFDGTMGLSGTEFLDPPFTTEELKRLASAADALVVVRPPGSDAFP